MPRYLGFKIIAVGFAAFFTFERVFTCNYVANYTFLIIMPYIFSNCGYL